MKYLGLFSLSLLVASAALTGCGANNSRESAAVSAENNQQSPSLGVPSGPVIVTPATPIEASRWHVCDVFIIEPAGGASAADLLGTSHTVVGSVPKGKYFRKGTKNHKFSDVYMVDDQGFKGDIAEENVLDTCLDDTSTIDGVLALADVGFHPGHPTSTSGAAPCNLKGGEGYKLTSLSVTSSDAYAKIELESAPTGCSNKVGYVDKTKIVDGDMYYGPTSEGLKRLAEIKAAEVTSPAIPSAPVVHTTVAPGDNSLCSMSSTYIKYKSDYLYDIANPDARIAKFIALTWTGLCTPVPNNVCSMSSSYIKFNSDYLYDIANVDQRIEKFLALRADPVCQAGFGKKCSMSSTYIKRNSDYLYDIANVQTRIAKFKEVVATGVCD